MKMFLTAFGLHNPTAVSPLPNHAIIPVAVDSEDGVDLDYSSLVLAESFIMDKTAYEYILERANTYLSPMAETLKVLHDNKLLELIDYQTLIIPYETKIIEKTSQLIDHIDPWVPIARRQWATVKDEFEDFYKRYGDPNNRIIEATHYGVSCLLNQRGSLNNLPELKRLEELLTSKRIRLNKSEEDDFKEIIRPLVSQVLLNNLLRTLLNSPFLDWDDAQEFYHHLDIGHWTGLDLKNETFDDTALISQARCLFSIVIPELLPKRVDQLVEFIKNRKAVISLRKELWDMLSEGRPISKDWFIEMQSEATRAKIKSENRNRVVKWVGRIAGFAIPGGGAIGDILSDVITIGAEEVSAKSWENKPNSRYEWYYALQHIALKQTNCFNK